MALLLLDPNLASTQGHHLAYDLRIAREAVRRGQAVTIMANRAFPAGMLEGVRIVPFFSESCYGAGAAATDPIGGRFDEFRRLNDTLAEDLSRLPRAELGAADCVLVPTVNENHLLGYVSWMKGFGALDAPLFVVHLMLPSGLAVADADDPGVVEDAQRALFYRLAFRAAWAPGGPAIRFFASGRQHALDFSRLAEAPVEPHPVPIAPKPSAPPPAAPRRRALLFAGDAKLDKGLALLPELARRLCAAHPDWTFVIQANPEIAWGPAREALDEVARIAPRLANLELGIGRLDEAGYLALLNGVDTMLFTYDPAQYGRKSSGVLWEAISLGKPVVVPRDTWLEWEARAWGAGHVPYAPYGAQAAAAAFGTALARLPALGAASAEAGARWRAANGAGPLFDQLGRLWAARLLAVSLAARPRETALDLAGLQTPGWHPAERVEGAVVRWTDKQAVIRFDWPHRVAWDLEIVLRNSFGHEQLAGATARGGTGAASRPLPVAVAHGADGAAVLTIAGPAEPRGGGQVEVALVLPFTYRPENEQRDLGVLVTGVRLRPQGAVGARGAAASSAGRSAAMPPSIRADRLAEPDGSIVVGHVLSGDLIADPDRPVRLALRLRCPSGPAAARRLGLWVNGEPVRLDLAADAGPSETAEWEGLAQVPPALLRRGGLASAWDLTDPRADSGAGPTRLVSIEARDAADAPAEHAGSAVPYAAQAGPTVAVPTVDVGAATPVAPTVAPDAALVAASQPGADRAPAAGNAVRGVAEAAPEAGLPRSGPVGAGAGGEARADAAVADALAGGAASPLAVPGAAVTAEAAPPPAVQSADATPPWSDPAGPAAPLVIRWDLSHGFGGLEGPFHEIGLAEPIRWVTARSATLVIEAREAMPEAPLRLRYRSMIPSQSATVRVNGAPCGDLAFGGSGRLDEPGEAVLDRVALRTGPNTLALGFAEAVAEPGSGRDLVLLVEAVEVG